MKSREHDPFTEFKQTQKQSWGLFSPLEIVTTIPAGELVKFAQVKPAHTVLDVGTGTGVVAITAARQGAKVSALDLSPNLLVRARENARIASVEIPFVEGDVEALPYPDHSFDMVLSQFGHMFAPRPEVAIREMLRVLKPGGRIAFSTWPPEHYVGQMFSLVSRYVPPPEGAAPPPQWGDPGTVRSRLGDAVTELVFDRSAMMFPVLSLGHYRESLEKTLGPIVKLVEITKNDPEKLNRFRSELDQLVLKYLENTALRQHFLMTRATKRP